MSLICVGLMSGTSMDGIDAVVMETDGRQLVKMPLAKASLAYHPHFHLLLRTAEYVVRQAKGDLQSAWRHYSEGCRHYLSQTGAATEPLSLYQALAHYLHGDAQAEISLDAIIRHSTLLHAELVQRVLSLAGLQPREVDVIGYHGQNLYHNPAERITVQGGDGQLLADETGIFVINDFRSNDVRHGGQGAPFAPLYHQALAAKLQRYPVAIVNCGGISNVSIVWGEGEKDLVGYDAGPGNILIDGYIREHTGNKEFMDHNGKYGLQGKVDDAMLALLKTESFVAHQKDYLKKLPPKSLDAGDFRRMEPLNSLRFEDACATFEVFTAACIVESLALLQKPETAPSWPPHLWILAGGGWHNPVITTALTNLLKAHIGPEVQVQWADAVGWDSTYMEAEIFAYLAARSMQGLPISFPAVTQVQKPMKGGCGYRPKAGATAQVEALLAVNPDLLCK